MGIHAAIKWELQSFVCWVVLIFNLSRTVGCWVRWGFGWGQRVNCVLGFAMDINLMELIDGSFCPLCAFKLTAGSVSARIIFHHFGNFQTSPIRNTPAAQLTGWPWGWETETGSWCCGRGLPSLQSCVWLLCWWRCNAGRLPVRTWGWRTEESSLGSCITGSCWERERERRREESFNEQLGLCKQKSDLRLNCLIANQLYNKKCYLSLNTQSS